MLGLGPAGACAIFLGAGMAIVCFGGCSSSGSTGGAGGAGASSGCNVTECLRPYECVEQCGGPVVHAGCCACEAPLIDQASCALDASPVDVDQGLDAGACSPGVTSTSRCQTAGSVCTAPDICCRCLDFPQTPSCGLQWACAVPTNNAAACPPDAPSEGSACSALKMTCQYCAQDGPEYWTCNSADGSGMWTQVPALSCNG
jgi:hypothetical protein